MRTLQRLLTDLLNLFFHDPEDRHQLWGWWKIIWVLAVVVGLFWMLAISGYEDGRPGSTVKANRQGLRRPLP